MRLIRAEHVRRARRSSALWIEKQQRWQKSQHSMWGRSWAEVEAVPDTRGTAMQSQWQAEAQIAAEASASSGRQVSSGASAVLQRRAAQQEGAPMSEKKQGKQPKRATGNTQRQHDRGTDGQMAGGDTRQRVTTSSMGGGGHAGGIGGGSGGDGAPGSSDGTGLQRDAATGNYCGTSDRDTAKNYCGTCDDDRAEFSCVGCVPSRQAGCGQENGNGRRRTDHVLRFTNRAYSQLRAFLLCDVGIGGRTRQAKRPRGDG